MSLELIVAEDVPLPRGHFSHAVKVGGLIYVSGLLALDDEGNVVGAGNVELQSDYIFGNLRRVLRAAGASVEDVVKLATYVVDIADRGVFNQVRARHLGAAHRPASTLVGVAALGAAGAVVEVDAIAAPGHAVERIS